MITLLQDYFEKSLKYGTYPGKLWFILTYIFRIFIITGISDSVWGDEQSRFDCSVAIQGCKAQCFNAFNIINPPRYWKIWILVTSTPFIIFQLFSLYVHAQKKKEEKMRELALENDEMNPETQKAINKLARKRRLVGNGDLQIVDDEGKEAEVPDTTTIKIAHIASIIIRLVLEIVFTIKSQHLYNFNVTTGTREPGHLFSFLTMGSPFSYRCGFNNDPYVAEACFSAKTAYGKRTGSIPCYISKYYEKSLLIRLMSAISFACLLLCVWELILAIKKIVRKNPKKYGNIIKFQDPPIVRNNQQIRKQHKISNNNSICSDDPLNIRNREDVGLYSGASSLSDVSQSSEKQVILLPTLVTRS